MIKLRTDGNFWTGTNAERISSFSAPFKEGLTFYTTDTSNWYFILQQSWVLVGGSVHRGLRTIIASDTVLATDYTILVDSSLAAITVTLGTLNAGRIINIKNIDDTLGVTIDPGVNNIDSVAGTLVVGLNSNVQLQSDGTDFWIL